MALSNSQQTPSKVDECKLPTTHSLSIVMPAHNEEVAIAETLHAVVDAVSTWVPDYEVIVVNDGSKDSTRSIVEEIAASNPHVQLVNHPVNRGYGAALVSGFEACSKDLVLFMDSDGQFDIHDLERFFPYIDEYDAVLGYRVQRQDTWILYKFTRAGYTYTQLGVCHLPRRGGRSTGARPSVIARAFGEMFTYAWRWRRKETHHGLK